MVSDVEDGYTIELHRLFAGIRREQLLPGRLTIDIVMDPSAVNDLPGDDLMIPVLLPCEPARVHEYLRSNGYIKSLDVRPGEGHEGLTCTVVADMCRELTRNNQSLREEVTVLRAERDELLGKLSREGLREETDSGDGDDE